MSDMVPKLSEMRSGTSLVACRFPLPECGHFQSIAQIGEGIDAVYFYKFFTLTPEQFKTYQLERKELGIVYGYRSIPKGELVREESQQSD
ncbi:hypothetical protein OSTOST_23051 [Ostertagia ostertagi]